MATNQELISKFCKISITKLRELKLQLQLSMNEERLILIREYYKKYAKRNPDEEELKLLDAIGTLPPSDLDAAPSELYTNDAQISQTYADLMKKRYELYEGFGGKCSLGEMFGIANSYLARCGKFSKENLEWIHRDGSFFKNVPGIVGVGNANHLLWVNTEKSTARKLLQEKLDLLILVSPGRMPAWSYGEELKKQLQLPEMQTAVRSCIKVSKEGLLPLIIRKSGGVLLDLSRFRQDRGTAPIRLLVGHFADQMLLTVGEADAEKVVKQLASVGFHASVIGNLTDDRQFSWIEGNRILALQLPFLRTLLPGYFGSVKLTDEESRKRSEINTVLSARNESHYLASFEKGTETVGIENRLISGAVSLLRENPFYSTVYTMLEAVLPSAVRGKDWTQTQLAVSLALPTSAENPYTVGSAVSALLGIYRVQTELALPASAMNLELSPIRKNAELTVFSVMPDACANDRLTANGNRVYCIAPEICPDGLPNFHNLRKMLQDISSGITGGRIQSVHTFFGKSVTEAVANLQENHKRISLTDSSIAAGEALEIGFLLESRDVLPFRQIGIVAEAPKIPEAEIPSIETHAIPNDQYEITVYGNVDDLGTQALASVLAGYGLRATYFPSDCRPDVLARSILTSHLMIVCGKTELPSAPSVVFATKVMKEAGGAVWHLGTPLNRPEWIEMGESIPRDIFKSVFFLHKPL